MTEIAKRPVIDVGAAAMHPDAICSMTEALTEGTSAEVRRYLADMGAMLQGGHPLIPSEMAWLGPLPRDSYSRRSSSTAASMLSRSSSKTSASSFAVIGSSATKMRASARAISSAGVLEGFRISCSSSLIELEANRIDRMHRINQSPILFYPVHPVKKPSSK